MTSAKEKKSKFKMRIPHTKSRSELIKELDKYFSIFIRTRDADEFGFANCFTCGKRNLWKAMDNGHFVGRGHMGTRFDERNCHIQCKHCNLFCEGKKDVYAVRLQKKYGEAILSHLQMKKNNRMETESIHILITEYKNRVKKWL